MSDAVKHPKHYGDNRFGLECIKFARYMTFPAGNAFKYVWRYQDKGKPEEDLNKALEYLEWAKLDHLGLGVKAVLPGMENHISILAAEYLIPVLRKRKVTTSGGYWALYYILVDEYGNAKEVINREISFYGEAAR